MSGCGRERAKDKSQTPEKKSPPEEAKMTKKFSACVPFPSFGQGGGGNEGMPWFMSFSQKEEKLFYRRSFRFFLSLYIVVYTAKVTVYFRRVKLYYTKHSFPDIPIIGGKPRFFSSLQPEQLFLLSFFFLGKRGGTGKNFFPRRFSVTGNNSISCPIPPLFPPSGSLPLLPPQGNGGRGDA